MGEPAVDAPPALVGRDVLAVRLLPLLPDRPARAVRARALAAVLRAMAVLAHRGDGVAPTVREIATEARLSAPSTVRHHQAALHALGLVRLSPVPGSPRSAVLSPRGRELTAKETP